MSECDEDGCIIVSPDEWLAKKMEQKIIEDSRKKIESGFADEPRESIIGPVPGDDWQATNFNTEIVDVKLPEDVVVLPFLGFPIEEVTELDWHIWRERRRLKPLNDAREYLASCSDEKDAESCAFWKAKREKLFGEHMERAKILAEADAAREQAEAAYIHNQPTMSRDAWIEEMNRALSQFPEADAESWKDCWDGKISIEKHRELIDDANFELYGAKLEIHHLIITNRVLTILLIFSTAFGITAALAWLRCQ